MKLFFMADIHGSSYYLNLAIQQFKNEQASHIVILGDELYHGARNPLPRDYNPKLCIEMLNQYADRIIAVRGNCDSEVDEMVLNYPIMSTYSFIMHEGKRLFLTHGHVFNENSMPKLAAGDAFIYGHTHVLKAESINGITVINPGSVSLPKENNLNTYGVLSDTVFSIKTLEGNIVTTITL